MPKLVGQNEEKPCLNCVKEIPFSILPENLILVSLIRYYSHDTQKYRRVKKEWINDTYDTEKVLLPFFYVLAFFCIHLIDLVECVEKSENSFNMNLQTNFDILAND